MWTWLAHALFGRALGFPARPFPDHGPCGPCVPTYRTEVTPDGDILLILTDAAGDCLTAELNPWAAAALAKQLEADVARAGGVRLYRGGRQTP